MNERLYTDIKKEITTIVNTMTSNKNIEFNAHNTIVHLTTTLIRLKSKNYIPLSYNQTANFKDHQLFDLANSICSEISTTYSVVFPTNEIAYLTMYLSNQTLLDQEFDTHFDILSDDTMLILKETKEIIDEKYPDNKILSNNFHALGLHLQQALNRLKDNKQVENPLAKEIFDKYPLETSYSKLCNEVIQNKYQKQLTDDELAFITLHLISKRA